MTTETTKASNSVTASAPPVFVQVKTATGTTDVPLNLVRRIDWADTFPVRRPMSYRGQRSKPGLFYMARLDRHVSYESRMEMGHLMLVDMQPDVVNVHPQPFRVVWDEDGKARRHTPDFLVEYRDGPPEVLDVKGTLEAERPGNAHVFEVTRVACAEAGLKFRVAKDVEPNLAANVQWLNAYKVPCTRLDVIAPIVFDVVSDGPVAFDDLVTLVSARSGYIAAFVMPAVLHLVWAREIQVDLAFPIVGSSHLWVTT